MSSEEKIEKLIDDYVDKYARKHHTTRKKAREHAVVKLAEAYFKEDNKDENRTYQI